MVKVLQMYKCLRKGLRRSGKSSLYISTRITCNIYSSSRDVLPTANPDCKRSHNDLV